MFKFIFTNQVAQAVPQSLVVYGTVLSSCVDPGTGGTQRAQAPKKFLPSRRRENLARVKELSRSERSVGLRNQVGSHSRTHVFRLRKPSTLGLSFFLPCFHEEVPVGKDSRFRLGCSIGTLYPGTHSPHLPLAQRRPPVPTGGTPRHGSGEWVRSLLKQRSVPLRCKGHVCTQISNLTPPPPPRGWTQT